LSMYKRRTFHRTRIALKNSRQPLIKSFISIVPNTPQPCATDPIASVYHSLDTSSRIWDPSSNPREQLILKQSGTQFRVASQNPMYLGLD
jgi:hypothetical protein